MWSKQSSVNSLKSQEVGRHCSQILVYSHGTRLGTKNSAAFDVEGGSKQPAAVTGQLQLQTCYAGNAA